MPFSLQLTRWGRGLARALGLQGQVPLTLIEDLAPVAKLIDERDPETAFLLGQRRWAKGETKAAVVGEFSWVELHNPEGSGLLVVVERILPFLIPATGAKLGLFFGEVGIAGGGILQPKDSRLQNDRHVATIFTGSQAGATFPLFVVLDYIIGTQGAWRDSGVVLSPGTSLRLETVAVNGALSVLFDWREFQPAPQELRG